MKIENREKFLTFVAIGVIALFAGDRLVVSPLIRLWKNRSNQIADLTKSLAKGKVLLDRERAIKGRWEQMKSNALPSNLSVAGNNILKAVDRWQRESQIGLQGIKPQRKLGEDFVTVEYRVDASGGIEAATRFLYELEQDPLPLKVEDLEITTRDDNGEQLSFGVRFSGLILSAEEK